MSCSDDLTITPGSDWALRCIVTDESGLPVNLTGYVASIQDVTGDLGSALSGAVIDEDAGEVELSGTWQPSWPLTGGILGSHRFMLVNGGDETASFPARVIVDGSVERVYLARGSDLQVDFEWPDDRLCLDMSGDSLTVINASAELVARVTASIVDPAARLVRWQIEGDLATPLGSLGTFQLQRATGGLHRRTTIRIEVICQ